MEPFMVGSIVRLINRAQLFVIKEGSGSMASIHKGTKLTCIQNPREGAVVGTSDFIESDRQFVCVQLPNEKTGYVRASAVVRI